MEIKIKESESGIRLDVFLSKYTSLSRSTIAKHIKKDQVFVNEEEVKCGYILKSNDIIKMNKINLELKVSGENIPLDIYYEDEYLLVVNKPSGMVVHPAPGNYEHTLVNALIYYTKNNLSNVGKEFRPGIVHRIDKDTSGLLLIAKDNKVHESLSKMFKEKSIKRKYIALVSGIINESTGDINAPLGRSLTDRKKIAIREDGKKAITHFRVLERYKESTLLELILETGRTHQIRVHLSYIKHPVINDPVYGEKIVNNYGQMLHAYYLGFVHPVTGKFMEFQCPYEKRFEEILDMFKNS